MQENMRKRDKKPRYSISVTSETYERLRAVAAPGSLACFVDEIVTSALDDPKILAALLVKCRQARAVVTASRSDVNLSPPALVEM